MNDWERSSWTKSEQPRVDRDVRKGSHLVDLLLDTVVRRTSVVQQLDQLLQRARCGHPLCRHRFTSFVPLESDSEKRVGAEESMLVMRIALLIAHMPPNFFKKAIHETRRGRRLASQITSAVVPKVSVPSHQNASKIQPKRDATMNSRRWGRLDLSRAGRRGTVR
jgi:hypothetical protein